MKLDFALLADRAVGKEDGKIDIEGGGISHVTATELPTMVPALAFVVRLLLEDADRGVARQTRFRVRTAAGQDLIASPNYPITAEATTRVPGPGGGDDKAALVMVIQLGQLVFPAFGVYTIEMFLDDDVIASKGLAVIPGSGTTREVLRIASTRGARPGGTQDDTGENA